MPHLFVRLHSCERKVLRVAGLKGGGAWLRVIALSIPSSGQVTSAAALSPQGPGYR